MAPWGIILIAAAAAVFLFVIAPALLIFIAVFYHKKAIPFEQYDLKKYQNHYYIPFLSRIAAAREWIQSKPHTRVWQNSYDGLRLLGDYYDRGAARTASRGGAEHRDQKRARGLPCCLPIHPPFAPHS